MFGGLPAPMLARLEQKLPRGDSWRYEPKLDGFRGLLWRRTATSSQLLSRNLRDLGPWFPEILRAASRLPVGTLLDGEIVICDESGVSEFGRLQERLSTARTRVGDLVREHPAVLAVFDLLEHDGLSLAAQSLAARRLCLEAHLTGIDPCLQVVAHTDSLKLATDWLSLPQLEGVVAKRADRPYGSGRTGDWVKVKRQRSVDCAVVGVAGDVGAPKLVLALKHADHQLHHFAVTRPLSSEHAGPLAEIIDQAGPEQAPIPSRWQHDAVPPWRRVPVKLVCEVRVTNLDAGRWARFPAAFLRWRFDLTPESCAIEQLLF